MNNTEYRGAESILTKDNWLGRTVLHKQRVPKKYRIKEIDAIFRKQRMIFEARLLAKAKEAGVRVPIIYEIDLERTTLTLEYIKGSILKKLLPKLKVTERAKISKMIGQNIGLLHNAGIIHGDLTTSNMIYAKESKQVVFIDFGLGFISDKIEDKGMDMYLLEYAMKNTHPEAFQEIWKNILLGYKEVSSNGTIIEKKIIEIASRGRYSERV